MREALREGWGGLGRAGRRLENGGAPPSAVNQPVTGQATRRGEPGAGEGPRGRAALAGTSASAAALSPPGATAPAGAGAASSSPPPGVASTAPNAGPQADSPAGAGAEGPHRGGLRRVQLPRAPAL